MTRIVIVAVSTLLFLTAGCVTEEGIQQKWDDYVADHNSCQAASDCVSIYPGCPLGCFEAVSASDKSDAEAEAARLVDKYESGGRACDYSCVEPGPLVCEAGHCGFGPAEQPGTNL